ncbi:hypothetical protein [Endozoicomonas sp. ONNA1]|nr:hypothetical protein [Endozoicomonas sp. ONNA1]
MPVIPFHGKPDCRILLIIPERKSVRGFMKSVVLPAIKSLSRELEEQGVAVGIDFD